MRSTFLIAVPLCLAFSVAFGQTNTEKAQFVEKALNRISKEITDPEAELIVQRERLRRMDEQSRRKLENALIERAKAEQTLSDLVRLKKELERLSPSPATLISLKNIKAESNKANERLDDMRATENKARSEAEISSLRFMLCSALCSAQTTALPKKIVVGSVEGVVCSG